MKTYFKVAQIVFIAIIINSCGSTDEGADPCANGPEIAVSKLTATTDGNSNGSFTAETVNGKAPYQYSLDGGAFQSGSTFSGLVANTYSISAKDANDCLDEIEVIIRSVPEVSFTSQVKPIIDTNCQISGCHGSNTSIPSWATYTQVKANANNIKSKTSTKVMPPTGALSDTNIKLIADWVDQGAPNN